MILIVEFLMPTMASPNRNSIRMSAERTKHENRENPQQRQFVRKAIMTARGRLPKENCHIQLKFNLRPWQYGYSSVLIVVWDI